MKKDTFIWNAAHERDEFLSTRDGDDPSVDTGIFFSYPFMQLPYWSEEFLVPDSMHTCANEVNVTVLLACLKLQQLPFVFCMLPRQRPSPSHHHFHTNGV